MWTLPSEARVGLKGLGWRFLTLTERSLKEWRAIDRWVRQILIAVEWEKVPWRERTVTCSEITFFASSPKTPMWCIPNARSLRPGPITAKRASYLYYKISPPTICIKWGDIVDKYSNPSIDLCHPDRTRLSSEASRYLPAKNKPMIQFSN